MLFQQNDNSSNVNEGQEGSVVFVIASKYPAKPFELLEKAFNQMALLVGVPVHGHGRKLCVSEIRQSQEWRSGNRAESGEHPLLYHSPGRGARYARHRRECRGTLPGILLPGGFVRA